MRALVVVGAATAATAAGLGWLRREGSRAMFRPPVPAAPVAPPTGMQLLRSSGPSGVPILYAPPSPGASTVVYLHGNATDISTAVPLIYSLREAGFGAAAVEYVGYGPDARRSPSARRLVEGSCEALDSVAARPETGPITLLGFSLGAAVATQVAARRAVERLVLGAPFTSAAALARLLAPRVPAAFFLDPRQFDSLGTAPSVRVPTLVVHGSADEQIPVSMGRALASRFPHGAVLEVPGTDHNGLAAVLPEAVRIAATDPAAWPRTWPKP